MYKINRINKIFKIGNKIWNLCLKFDSMLFDKLVFCNLLIVVLYLFWELVIFFEIVECVCKCDLLIGSLFVELKELEVLLFCWLEEDCFFVNVDIIFGKGVVLESVGMVGLERGIIIDGEVGDGIDWELEELFFEMEVDVSLEFWDLVVLKDGWMVVGLWDMIVKLDVVCVVVRIYDG